MNITARGRRWYAWAMAAAIGAAAPGARAEPLPERYQGLCDASAAIALEADHFVVADDEGNVLRLYRRDLEAPVGAGVDLVAYLHAGINKKGALRESDLEGSAAIGNRIYWIGSHSRKVDDDGKSEPDPRRWRFFATEPVAGAVPPQVKPVGTQPYEHLLEDLIDDPRYDFLKKAIGKGGAEDPGGFNIEGLAAGEQGTLLIGLRNPQRNKHALLVPLLNPPEVVEQQARARFGEPVELPLAGRGIRSIERIGAEYFVVGGPFGPKSKPRPPFVLYRWSGNPQQPPKHFQDLPAGFGAEALFADPAHNELVLLSDDGDELIDGKKCKKSAAERKSFRVLRVPLPAPG